MITTGLERLLAAPESLKGRRVALVANQTSLTREFEYSWHALPERGIPLRRIFTPEHGLFAIEQDQVAVGFEPETGTETVSLYGSTADSLVPEKEMLCDLDLIVFDIQDVGSRYYTYVNTLALLMEAVSGMGIEIMVLDRPNPLGGTAVEGPMLDMAFRSFVGVFPVPVRHGLTAGELAHLWRDYRKLDVELSVVAMEGWRRSMLFDETGLAWVPPSPNMPGAATAMVYPGMCLFEGLNVSEGRGTTTPFELSGAPFVHPEALAAECASAGLPGIAFRPAWFRPGFHKFAGEAVGAVALQVTDPRRFRPFATGVAMTAALHRLYPDKLRFLRGVYEFNDTVPAFDLLAGSAAVRTAIETGVPTAEIIGSWRADEAAFAAEKQAFHLYGS
ncbi:DUF1343 domain-containing protein [Chlorobium sp. N1]|uniref:exo-beta-N-acetylmuramidase NamZ family protein n=1 Tax=Chlorobium sp. N1 TaxID=2491138 RepID=UPI00103AA784|nr:DUF1343 domain-containing protein [Chlorobium sp. N1]TCD48074.1 DUF1343 domain-containing protein [Chlorobium sp. N1]